MATTINIFTGESIKFKTNRKEKGKSLIESPCDYCIIDIETTGLSPIWDDIIEISAIKYRNNSLIDTFSHLVKPENFDDYYPEFLDDFIVNLTGITDEMLSSAENTKIVLENFYNFIGDDILIGHNINFDINFLYDNSIKYLDKPLKNNFIDTMRISKRLYPGERNRLVDLCQRFSLSYDGAHRALKDCEITNQCYRILINKTNEQYGSMNELRKEILRKKQGVKASEISANTTDFDPSHPLYNKVCVFTGTLERMVRRDAMQIVSNFGGINADSVTKKTNFLILGNNDYCKSIKDGKSSKQKKAEKLKLNGQDIEIIPENVFYDMISFD